MRVAVKPEMLLWACERAGIAAENASEVYAGVDAWLSGTKQPTLKQLEGFAKKSHTPVGYFFLDAPPDEKVPIPDFRTVRGKSIKRPSANLLDTIYACQERQDWYRDYQQVNGEESLPFIGSMSVSTSITHAAKTIADALGWQIQERKKFATWEEALRRFVEQAESLGILVMTNGVVGSNTHRALDPDEFRGFALVDPIAPLVFINGADSKAAQMFTLAHELAHLWVGKSALSNVGPEVAPDATAKGSESWCNKVAAELLVPAADFRSQFDAKATLANELRRLARVYKVSTLVVLRRLFDIGKISKRAFDAAYKNESARLAQRTGSGGDFYATAPVRVSRRFLRALLGSTYSGHTLFTDTFRMVGFRSSKTLERLATDLGVR